MPMKSFRVIIEYADGNYSASCPEVPVCFAVGLTSEEALKNYRQALEQFVEDEEDIRHGMKILARIKDHPEELLDAEEVFQELGL